MCFICKDMSSSVNVSEVKLLKTLKRILYIIQENKQLKSNKLPVVQWRITNKQKKILGYDCHEAFTKYKIKH
jgi:GLPGLI family protein